MYLRRFGVDPDHQGHGVARALIDAAVEAAKGYEDLTVVAREELPNTIQFWERQGFREILRETPNVESGGRCARSCSTCRTPTRCASSAPTWPGSSRPAT